MRDKLVFYIPTPQTGVVYSDSSMTKLIENHERAANNMCVVK